MKISMTLTMDGLIRALRWKAHVLAENVVAERGNQSPEAGGTLRPATRRGRRTAREASDVGSGR